MTTKDKILFTAGFLLIFSLASPAFAQAYPITLYADQSSAGAGDTVKFTITWLETSVVKIDFTKVEFQYKKLADSTWTTFSATEGTSERLSLVLPTRGGSGTMREFTAKMSGAIGEQTAYQFRVRDRHYPAGSDASAPVTLTVSNKVVYGAYGALKIIPGSGYTTSGAADAYVKVKQGNQLGTGVKILYDFSIENQGSGGAAGQTFLVTVISNDATLSDSESDRNSGSSIFKIISVTRPDGTVEAGSGNSITLLPGRTTLRMEVEAPSDIAPGVQAYRVVTFRATNIAAKNAGQNVKAEASARITADTIRDCVDRLDPTVSVTPPSKVGDPGQTLMYTIVVKNQDTGGCEPRTVNINKIGLQQLLPPASDYDYVGEGARRDDNGMKWGIVLRGIFNGKTTDITYRQGGTFTEGFTDYVSFSGSGATFRLSPADASGGNDRKVMILKVTSYVGETKASQRGVRICTSDGCGAQSAVFDLQNPFDPKRKPSQSGETVSDSVLTDPDKNLPASSGTGGTGGGGGGTVGGVPIVPAKPPKVDLDPTWLANCKACAVQPNKGFNTDTQACAEGDAGGSGKVDPALKMVNPVNYDNKASNGKDNWIFLPTENSRQIIKDTARKKRAYTCEKPPKGVGLSSSTGNSPIVSSGCSSKTSCSACTPDTANSCGWSVKQAKCITGTASGSNDGSSGTGDW
ncbi:MAG: hypothetical protein HY833_01050, partial [Candidatus Aenigmarchaeota archaeon]|nr:hypothetical protein [Candidatus Aenigmarchaeota archaeon]